MKINIKYTITEVMQEDTGNWESCDFTGMSDKQIRDTVLTKVRETVAEDPSYVINGLNYYTIQAELTFAETSQEQFQASLDNKSKEE